MCAVVGTSYFGRALSFNSGTTVDVTVREVWPREVYGRIEEERAEFSWIGGGWDDLQGSSKGL